MASTYLTRTPSSASNRKTFTWSGWVKRSSLGAIQGLLSVDTGSAEHALGFLADDTLRLYLHLGPNYPTIETTQVFRDTSAWYHILVAVDTTQSTEADRVKIYVNGSQVTAFDTASYPSQNVDTDFNTTNPHMIGFYANQTGGAGYFDGYMAHAHFTDGTAYTPSSFGSTATNGQWIPNTSPSVTYGTNGYFLKFTNASDLGEDFSGNNNDFTKSGSGDKVLDNPQNVFATLNPLDKDGHTNADGNLEMSGDVVYGMQRGTIGASSGKWYFEARLDVYQGDTAIALANEDENVFTRFTGETTNSVGYLADGRFFYNSSATNYSSLSAGDIFQIAFDADSGKIWIGKNNTWQNSGDPANGSGQVQTVSWNFFLPAARTVNNNGNGKLHYNFGQDSSFAGASTAQNNSDGKYGDFYYAPPSGFYALCTKRLAEFG